MWQLLRISEAASLALHTMALLARESQQRRANGEIAERLGASSHHLAKVMQRLAKAGLIDSTRGPLGGFQLGKPADEISLLEIYEAMEGSLAEEGCFLAEPVCGGRKKCILGDAVRQVHRLVRDHLRKTSLSELAFQAAFLRK